MEVVGNVQIDAIKLEAEHKWLGSLLVDKIQMGPARPVFKSSWKVKTTKEEFSDWWKNEKKIFQSSSLEHQTEILGKLGHED